MLSAFAARAPERKISPVVVGGVLREVWNAGWTIYDWLRWYSDQEQWWSDKIAALEQELAEAQARLADVRAAKAAAEATAGGAS